MDKVNWQELDCVNLMDIFAWIQAQALDGSSCIKDILALFLYNVRIWRQSSIFIYVNN